MQSNLIQSDAFESQDVSAEVGRGRGWKWKGGDETHYKINGRRADGRIFN